MDHFKQIIDKDKSVFGFGIEEFSLILFELIISLNNNEIFKLLLSIL